jgi:hypothetical protein
MLRVGAIVLHQADNKSYFGILSIAYVASALTPGFVVAI